MLGPAGLSSDSGLGGSTDGSTDILVFGSVVDSVTEEGMFRGFFHVDPPPPHPPKKNYAWLILMNSRHCPYVFAAVCTAIRRGIRGVLQR